MKTACKIIATVLCLVMLCPAALAAEEPSQAQQIESALAKRVGCKEGKLLTQEDVFPAGASGSDWIAMTLAAGGVKEEYGKYLTDLEKYVTDKYAQDGLLSDTMATDYARAIMTVTALGGDATAFGKNADGQSIDLVSDGIVNFENLGAQGLNGYVFALIALDSGGYLTDDATTQTRQNIIDDILQAQEDDGGFGFIPGGSDVDMTAMALQALAPYRDTYSQLTDKAVDYLASMLNDSGRYEVYGEESAETSAQVVIALCSLGIDPAQDERFTKTGGSILEGMEAYLNEDGLYAHTVGGDSDVMATQQVLLSLIALDRLRSGGDRVYDFTGLTLDSGSSTGINLKVILICAAVVVCAVIVIEVITIRRKKCNAGTDK